MVWEINMGVCPRLLFGDIMFINCLADDCYIFMVHLSFYAIPCKFRTSCMISLQHLRVPS